MSQQDTFAIRKRLLRTATTKRSREQQKLNNDLSKKTTTIKNILNSLDWLILNKALNKNINKHISKVLQTHWKKLKNLIKNNALPFAHKENVTNFSSHKFKDEYLDSLKNGFNFSIKPPRLKFSDVLTTFELIHHSIKEKLKNQVDCTRLKNELAYKAQNYISSYSPTPSDLKKYNILKNIRNNKNIILLKPGNGGGMVILDRQVNKDSCLKIINNQTKFKHLTKDPTLYKDKRQRLLRKLKNQGL